MNTSIQVFSNQYLATDEVITSQAIPAQGNKVVGSYITKNASGTGVTYYIDGSYDGSAWEEAIGAAVSATTLDHDTNNAATLDHAYVRIRAVGGTTAATAIFDAWLAFSEQ